MARASVLINLGSPDAELWRKSIGGLVVELQRAEQLGIPYVVLHPGSVTTASAEDRIERIASALDGVHSQTRGIAARCLIENTPGSGSQLGWRFEQLAAILAGVRDAERIGVCIGTCHLFAAGYAMAPEPAFNATMAEADRIIGLDRVKAFYVSDSAAKFGSRVGRHANIGRGQIGLEAFRALVNDRRFAQTPMYLRTPKGRENGRDLDEINLATLRGLVNAGPAASAANA